jgi:hypothetical protein
MANKERLPSFVVLDQEENRLDATWSKSMKSLIVTVGPPDPSARSWQQVLLNPDQVAELRDFIDRTHPG